MSYDVNFKVKIEGADVWVDVGGCDANITWNVGSIIRQSTGLDWKYCANNGPCTEIMHHIAVGLEELVTNGDNYRHLEASNGWGTVEGTIRFFKQIMDAWEDLTREWPREHLDKIMFFIT